jgi:Domain of unknown function (DUF1906)
MRSTRWRTYRPHKVTALDFSFERPSVQALLAADVIAVGRYLTGAGKAISVEELTSYLDAGIAVWFVYEVTATDVQGGHVAGVAHAQDANAALDGLGIPRSCPVYFSADQELADPTVAIPYYQGLIAGGRLSSTNGDYGEGALCQLLADQGLTALHWQSESSSFPGNEFTLPITNIQQSTAAPPVPGTDLDVLCKPDYGQWPRPAPPTPEEEPMGVSVATEFNGNVHVVQVSAGTIWHKSEVGTPTPGNESVLLKAGVSGVSFPDQVPGVAVIGNQLTVTAEDSNAGAWYFAHGAGGGWGAQRLP